MKEGYCEICGGLLVASRIRHNVDGVCLQELLPIPKDSKFPPVLTKVPGEINIDATPDENLPIRILEAFKDNYNCEFDVSGASLEQMEFWNIMNQANKDRIRIIDVTLAKLK